MYLILSGNFPFDGHHTEDDICSKPLTFYPPKRWDSISYEAKEVISKMLSKSPFERITIDQALDHKWIKKMLRNPEKDNDVFEIDMEVILRLN